MIVRFGTVGECGEMIPLLFKEGLGVVDWASGAGAHHPLPPPPAEEGNYLQNRKEIRGRDAKG